MRRARVPAPPRSSNGVSGPVTSKPRMQPRRPLPKSATVSAMPTSLPSGGVTIGRSLLRQGRIEEGLALLDETMVAATGGELSPVVTGIVYCAMIACCHQIYALDRAREWTAALSAWCDAQPELVTFTGTCLVHRAEIMQLNGAWGEAIDRSAPRR